MSSLAFDFDKHGHLVPRPAPRAPAPQPKIQEPAAAQPAVRRAPAPAPLARPPRPADLRLDRARDELLTPFGKATLRDRYLLPGESYQDMFARVACAYADDVEHAQRSTTTSRSSGSCRRRRCCRTAAPTRGLPISCFLNAVSDSLEGIVGTWNENVWLASRGGGIGTYWGNVRSIGETVGLNGKTSRHHPVHPRDGFADARDQPGLAAPRLGRRSISTSTIPRSRSSSRSASRRGDFNRKALNLHHGISSPTRS